jgi:hypothetical protein
MIIGRAGVPSLTAFSRNAKSTDCKVVARWRDVCRTMQTRNCAPRRLLRLAVWWWPRVFFRAAIRKTGFRRSSAGAEIKGTRGRIRRVGLVGHSLALVLALLLAGCSAPSVRQQRFVAKPSMTFSDFVAFSYNSSRLLPQLATGLSAAGGPQNSGCTSCR